MSNNTTDYGEPWTLEDITGDCERHILLRASNGRIISSEPSGDKDDPYLIRAKDCVNACAGLADPAEALRLAREALKSLSLYNIAAAYSVGAGIDAADMALVLKALSALTPNKPE